MVRVAVRITLGRRASDGGTGRDRTHGDPEQQEKKKDPHVIYPFLIGARLLSVLPMACGFSATRNCDRAEEDYVTARDWNSFIATFIPQHPKGRASRVGGRRSSQRTDSACGRHTAHLPTRRMLRDRAGIGEVVR
jgi:hypothetical protein